MTPAGRRPGPSTTSAAILSSARALFAQGGFQATTLRAIADDAGVNQALVRHFFGSKQQLFMAAIAFPEDGLATMMATLEATPRPELGEQIVRVFVRVWRDPGTSRQVQAFFRAAAAGEEGARMARSMAEQLLLPRVTTILHMDAATVAAMIAQLLGYAFVSTIIRAEPLASASEDDLVALLSPTIQAYLDRTG